MSRCYPYARGSSAPSTRRPCSPAAASPTGPDRPATRLPPVTQYVALLPVIERVLGPEHPDTLITRHDTARWTGQAGDPVGARDQYVALLPVIERVLGPEHPQTRRIRDYLAYWTGQ